MEYKTTNYQDIRPVFDILLLKSPMLYKYIVLDCNVEERVKVYEYIEKHLSQDKIKNIEHYLNYNGLHPYKEICAVINIFKNTPR